MGNQGPFRFKQFSVHHDRCALKVGTDGVLLGAIAGKGSPKNILEIGVGTGVVSLMLAQRFPEAVITGVEIDKEAWNQAAENARQSPWGDRIDFINMSFQDFCLSRKTKFDLVVSNPPYFSNHLKSSDSKRNIALHNDALPFCELTDGVISLLHETSEFWVILPPTQMGELETQTIRNNLNLVSKISIRDKSSKNILRLIYGFSFLNNTRTVRSITIKEESGDYSDDYSDLLKNFLIIF